ncbi:hypothetical protein FHR55_000579 [Xanthomonas arboricola]
MAPVRSGATWLRRTSAVDGRQCDALHPVHQANPFP